MSVAEKDVDIGHEAPYECEACGGPEWSATSLQGCRNCCAKDQIVARGTVARCKRAVRLLQDLVRGATDDDPFTAQFISLIGGATATATFGTKKVTVKFDTRFYAGDPAESVVTRKAWDRLAFRMQIIFNNPVAQVEALGSAGLRTKKSTLSKHIDPSSGGCS